MFQCPVCGLKLAEEKRLKIHFKTHEKKEVKNKKQRRRVMADFEKPDFSQVMWNPSQKIISNPMRGTEQYVGSKLPFG